MEKVTFKIKVLTVLLSVFILSSYCGCVFKGKADTVSSGSTSAQMETDKASSLPIIPSARAVSARDIHSNQQEN